MGDTKNNNRLEWLNANGFATDPFEITSFRAETDLWLKSSDFSAYWDWENIDSLAGNFDFPGYYFIFSSEGGGKTSLRKRIQYKYDDMQLSDSQSKALVIDYSDHTYSGNKIKIHNHVKRIIDQAEYGLRASLTQEKRLVNHSPYLALKELIKTSQKKFDFSGVLLLVDNLDLLSLYKIKELASYGRLFNLKQFVIKFFLPKELYFPAQLELPLSKFPFYLLEWKEKELLGAIKQRLKACLHPDLRVNQEVQPISLLLRNDLHNTFVNNFIKLGKLANNPRIMWKFGHFLIEEHLSGSRLRRTDLIGHDAFVKAYPRLFDELQKEKKLIKADEQNYYFHQNKSLRYGFKRKPQIYLCCEKRFEKEIMQDLYFKLETKGFRPWMLAHDILPGENREIEIKRAINTFDVFLLCLSSKSLKEPGDFQMAINLAKQRQIKMPPGDIFIVPLRLEDCPIPEELVGANYEPVDWFLEKKQLDLFYVLEQIKKRKQRKKV
jgi:hypothetical protein